MTIWGVTIWMLYSLIWFQVQFGKTLDAIFSDISLVTKRRRNKFPAILKNNAEQRLRYVLSFVLFKISKILRNWRRPLERIFSRVMLATQKNLNRTKKCVQTDFLQQVLAQNLYRIFLIYLTYILFRTLSLLKVVK